MAYCDINFELKEFGDNREGDEDMCNFLENRKERGRGERGSRVTAIL